MFLDLITFLIKDPIGNFEYLILVGDVFLLFLPCFLIVIMLIVVTIIISFYNIIILFSTCQIIKPFSNLVPYRRLQKF